MQDIDIDSQQAQELIVCMYAEFARSCYETAHVFATHAAQQPSADNNSGIDDVLVEDLIHAVRREAMHSGGFVARIRPLLRYVLNYGQLPQTGALVEHYDVDSADIARLFQHHAGVRQLMARQASSALLGDYMFACMTTGRTVDDILSAAQDWRTPLVGLSTADAAVLTDSLADDASAGSSHSEQNFQTTQADQMAKIETDDDDDDDYDDDDDDDDDDVGDTDDDLYKDWHYFGRGLCTCALCQSVQVARVSWASYCPENDIDRHLKQFCDSFEQRLTDVALQLA